MIIGAALALACGLVCKLVVEDDKGSAEKLVGSSGNGDASSGGSRGEWKGLILFGSAIKHGAATQRIQHL
jgi:hypothetical protein